MLGPYRSLLFVPGNKPSWAEKALRVAPDAIILDLEDAVPEDEKATARTMVRETIAHIRSLNTSIGILVRVNGLETKHTGADLEEVVVKGIDGIFAPKVEKATDVLRYDALVDHFETRNGVGGIQYIFPVETVQAIQNARGIAAGSHRVAGMVGATAEHADITREVGFEWTEEGLETLYLRSRVLLACREFGLHTLTGLWERVDDLDGLRNFALTGRQFGFRGMIAIHPSHIPVINQAYTLSPDEIEFLQGLVEAYEESITSGKGAFRYRGSHVDRAHYATAIQQLADARLQQKGN
jgi:citrate lyase subunit beta/citryl-CoA lyase